MENLSEKKILIKIYQCTCFPILKEASIMLFPLSFDVVSLHSGPSYNLEDRIWLMW